MSVPDTYASKARRGQIWQLLNAGGCLLVAAPFSVRDGRSYCRRVCPRHVREQSSPGANLAVARCGRCLLVGAPFSVRDGRSYCRRVCPRHVREQSSPGQIWQLLNVGGAFWLVLHSPSGTDGATGCTASTLYHSQSHGLSTFRPCFLP